MSRLNGEFTGEGIGKLSMYRVYNNPIPLLLLLLLLLLDVLLTVHFSIILVTNQLDAQILVL